MRQSLTIASCLFCSFSCLAANTAEYGYSYFTLGVENVHYQEQHGATQSSVTMLNPVLNSGGLYRINTDWDFSIDALGTFSPRNAQEQWQWQGQRLQDNQTEYLKTATHVQLHYKWQDHWRIVAGPSFTYQTYTRYAANTYLGQGHLQNVGTWKETMTQVYLDAGLGYDSGYLSGADGWLWKGKLMFGLPLWNRITNSQFADMSFDSFGFRTGLEGSLSYQIMPGLNVGGFMLFSYEKRFASQNKRVELNHCLTMEQGHCSEYQPRSASALVPEADTVTFSLGLQALWRF
ncbi:hypothetical protein [Vibrio metschnikovii]|uniref:hypothetical protein n=1 Tax=Vibrio metschnikovii TaxID=28172 RepID=UPI001C2F3196|nr:hypothetical protein [Vibrio metschnikovii]